MRLSKWWPEGAPDQQNPNQSKNYAVIGQTVFSSNIYSLYTCIVCGSVIVFFQFFTPKFINILSIITKGIKKVCGSNNRLYLAFWSIFNWMWCRWAICNMLLLGLILRLSYDRTQNRDLSDVIHFSRELQLYIVYK